MEKVKRSREEWIRRYLSFIFILFIIAFGTSLSIRANLGSSPISAAAIRSVAHTGNTVDNGYNSYHDARLVHHHPDTVAAQGL